MPLSVTLASSKLPTPRGIKASLISSFIVLRSPITQNYFQVSTKTVLYLKAMLTSPILSVDVRCCRYICNIRTLFRNIRSFSIDIAAQLNSSFYIPIRILSPFLQVQVKLCPNIQRSVILISYTLGWMDRKYSRMAQTFTPVEFTILCSLKENILLFFTVFICFSKHVLFIH